ncbi:hypothetical protein HN460_02645 [bacterium]|nr:hypothetical protein [bacterium]MBT3795573.1 hypothetical protein [bacterium]MBT4634066.1 hypothetical protein [bacterium]
MSKSPEEDSECNLEYLTAKHRALDIKISDSWNSYVTDSILRKLKIERGKIRAKIESIKTK